MSYKLVTTDGFYESECFESVDDAVNYAFYLLDPDEVTYFVKGRDDKTVAIIHENEVFTREAKKISPRANHQSPDSAQ